MVAVEHNHVLIAETLLAFDVESILGPVYLDGDNQTQFLNLIIRQVRGFV